MKRSLIVGSLLFMTFRASVAGQQRLSPKNQQNHQPTANVEVIAFESNGKFLGAPNVGVFEKLDDRRNLASTIHDGVGTGIPYGIYRVEARLPWHFSDSTYAAVYEPRVTIVMGLRFSQELPEAPLSLSGRVVALSSASTNKSFVKIVGVYEHLSSESKIDRDGKFELGGLADGLFILLVAGENGILASRTLSIPYTGPPLEIKIEGN